MNSESNKVAPPNRGYILVVDDDYDLNMTLCDILLSYDFEVKSASNGQEALRIITHERPDMVLSDIAMPVMDGHSLLQHARTNPNLRALPFIFLTSHGGIENQRQAMAVGIEDYLTKPIDTHDLILAVRNVYRRFQVTEEEIQLRTDSLRHEIVGLLQHEFRTPLTYVLTYAQYIQTIVDGEFEGSVEELRVATNGVLEGGQRLQRLIESFLLLSDLQNRTVALEAVSKCPVKSVIGKAVDVLRSHLEDARLQVIFEESDASDAEITCDGALVTEALSRLLDNSIRYGRAESRHIWISIQRDEKLNTGIRIRDEGVGIPSATIDSLSKPFAQGDRADCTKSGAGMSLAMIQHIAQLHRGYVEIQSKEGIGTSVTLWLGNLGPEAPKSAVDPAKRARLTGN